MKRSRTAPITALTARLEARGIPEGRQRVEARAPARPARCGRWGRASAGAPVDAEALGQPQRARSAGARRPRPPGCAPGRPAPSPASWARSSRRIPSLPMKVDPGEVDQDAAPRRRRWPRSPPRRRPSSPARSRSPANATTAQSPSLRVSIRSPAREPPPHSTCSAATTAPPRRRGGPRGHGGRLRRHLPAESQEARPARKLIESPHGTILADGVTSRDQRAGRDALLPPSRPRDAALVLQLRAPDLHVVHDPGRRRRPLPRVRPRRARSGPSRRRRGCAWPARTRPPDRHDGPRGLNILVFLVEMAQGVGVRGHRRRRRSCRTGRSTGRPSPTASGTGWSRRASCTPASSTSASTCGCSGCSAAPSSATPGSSACCSSTSPRSSGAPRGALVRRPTR